MGERSLAPLVPLTTFVVKVASRCNLNCSYCYMYNLQDRTYRDQPSVMNKQVTVAFAAKASQHALSHGAGSIHVILHGGEPLLLGKKGLREWVETVRRNAVPGINVLFSIQSNGVLVDEGWIDLLADLRVRLGISIDGPREIHDRFRLDHKGRGSFDRVVAAIHRLQEHPRGSQVFSNVMAVVSPDVSPDRMFDFWMDLGVPGFDLSLPHANHEFPPPKGRHTYGDWLIRFFDRYLDANRSDLNLRYFDNMLRMFFNYPASTDNIGGRPVDVVVVETNGSIEPTDAFKCCADGITKLHLNVCKNDFDELSAIPMVRELQGGRLTLCSECKACEALDVCGGGYMPHRYGAGHFQHPSVYCADLLRLIRHMRSRILESIPNPILERMVSPT